MPEVFLFVFFLIHFEHLRDVHRHKQAERDHDYQQDPQVPVPDILTESGNTVDKRFQPDANPQELFLFCPQRLHDEQRPADLHDEQAQLPDAFGQHRHRGSRLYDVRGSEKADDDVHPDRQRRFKTSIAQAKRDRVHVGRVVRQKDFDDQIAEKLSQRGAGQRKKNNIEGVMARDPRFHGWLVGDQGDDRKKQRDLKEYVCERAK